MRNINLVIGEKIKSECVPMQLTVRISNSEWINTYILKIIQAISIWHSVTDSITLEFRKDKVGTYLMLCKYRDITLQELEIKIAKHY
jgi:hypothetical protein